MFWKLKSQFVSPIFHSTALIKDTGTCSGGGTDTDTHKNTDTDTHPKADTDRHRHKHKSTHKHLQCYFDCSNAFCCILHCWLTLPHIAGNIVAHCWQHCRTSLMHVASHCWQHCRQTQRRKTFFGTINV